MKAEGAALKKLVGMGKRKTLSFAFCPGSKDGHTLLIDKRKKPSAIAKLAKKQGSGAKVAFGTFVLNAKTMELTCDRTVPALEKTLKRYLRLQKIPVKVEIMETDGKGS